MKIFTSIPSDIPETPTLDKIDVPSDIKNLSSIQLQSLADDVRAHLLYSVGQSGGHLGGGLGVVELTVALHYLYNAPEDKIVWDVGHQAYPHKILTGRKNLLTSIRQKDGLAPFPNRSESPFESQWQQQLALVFQFMSQREIWLLILAEELQKLP